MNDTFLPRLDQSSGAATWKKDPPAAEWDHALTTLSGHPLQSALWGESRRVIDGIQDVRWMGLCDGQPVWLARIERRRVLGGWVGWVPRGPTGDATTGPDFPTLLTKKLQREGMVLLITNPWLEQKNDIQQRYVSPTQTIWIDLSSGRDALWGRLAKNWRYNVGFARRRGVVVDVAAQADEITRFAGLCKTIADNKNFVLSGSQALMNYLLRHRESEVEARLFLARQNGVIRAGAFIIRCGRSLHYFWGATDRSPPQVGAGEAVQWAVIEWGLAKGCTRYDLEGIDSVRKLGTYFFKKKMGGTEVTLPGKHYVRFGPYSHVLGWLAEQSWLTSAAKRYIY
jgi:GNAT acetyltransferase-like protein